eukprot:TRINITY_DN8149_c0_g2_i3.p1 TRINITY_DN8149_c0_g2~~TRINITY_DN8149_c0_g2_i3.p1  ORF type:complete len:239 (-),score=38.25 TRINITY_DN8149_c0_g2_i3:10-726(-)
MASTDDVLARAVRMFESFGKEVEHVVNLLLIKDTIDLVRGIRDHREDENHYISTCMQEIKNELASNNHGLQANAVHKLCYLQLYGYSINWAAFKILEVISHEKFTHKRIGYLAATLTLSEKTEVVILITNLIRKDCLASKTYESGSAINCLAYICTPDLARDLVPDIVSMLSSNRPYIRKRALTCLFKIFLKFPDALRPTFSRLREKLEDEDTSVVASAVNVICELAKKKKKKKSTLR